MYTLEGLNIISSSNVTRMRPKVFLGVRITYKGLRFPLKSLLMSQEALGMLLETV